MHEDLGIEPRDFKSKDVILSVISLNCFLAALENAKKIDPNLSASKVLSCFFMLGVLPISNADNVITYGRDFNPATIPSTTVFIRGAISVINYWRGLTAALSVGVWVGFIFKRTPKSKTQNMFRTNPWAAKMSTPEELYRGVTSEEESNEEPSLLGEQEESNEDQDPYTYPFQLIPWAGHGSPSLKELEYRHPITSAKMYGKFIPVGIVAHHDSPRNNIYRPQYSKPVLNDISSYNTNLQIVLIPQY
jgi:hypothetical protein